MAQAGDHGGEVRFPVVGVGVSAGGLEAASALLDGLPADPGLAIVLVQHLAPQHESLLPELLARHTAMPVVKVEDRMAVERDHLYVIPPGVDMVIVHGHLDLFQRREPGARPLVIDQFLISLARDAGRRAIGVVLSGVGADGSRGLAAIKSAGGVALVQDPATARFDGMPQAAIASHVADAILGPPEIAAELARLARHPYVRRPVDATASEDALDDAARILSCMSQAYGVDFAGYKKGTIMRRTERRMVLQRIDSLREYAELVCSDRGELDALYHDVLSMVSEFFREPETYEALKKTVLPAILAEREPNSEVRVWVPGCAAGEEPYSIAMVLSEAMSDGGRRFPVKILATDVNERELVRARAGLYDEARVASLPERYRDRYMTHTDDGYRVKDAIRETCIFARHDVTRDPPFSRLDLVVCRNLLIYLGRGLQERVLPLLHYGLRADGFLMLGRSESLGAAADLFTTVDKRNKIFRKNDVVSHLPVMFGGPSPFALQAGIGPTGSGATIAGESDPLETAARVLLSEFSPPAVVVDSNLEIVQFSGETEPYLQHAAGRATFNVLAMAREGLAAPLRELVERARGQGSAQTMTGVRFGAAERPRTVDISVVPLAGPPADAYLLLVFSPRQQAIGRGPDVPTLIVDCGLAIRRFTPGSETLLNLITTDIGRPITDISSRLNVPDLRELLTDVIDNAATVDREVSDEGGRCYEMRVRPFRTAEGAIDGAVLTFLDIDELRRSLESIRASAQVSESLDRVIAALAATPTPALALPSLLQESAATMAADAAAIAAREGPGWVVKTGYNLPAGTVGVAFTDLEFPQAVLAAEARAAVAISLPDNADARAKVVKSLGLGSMLVAPLTVAGLVTGVLLYSWKASAAVHSETELDFVAKVAAIVSLATEHERLRRELEAG